MQKLLMPKKHIFIDTSNKISEKGLDAYSILGPHLNQIGYSIVANAIYDELDN